MQYNSTPRITYDNNLNPQMKYTINLQIKVLQHKSNIKHNMDTSQTPPQIYK